MVYHATLLHFQVVQAFMVGFSWEWYEWAGAKMFRFNFHFGPGLIGISRNYGFL